MIGPEVERARLAIVSIVVRERRKFWPSSCRPPCFDRECLDFECVECGRVVWGRNGMCSRKKVEAPEAAQWW